MRRFSLRSGDKDKVPNLTTPSNTPQFLIEVHTSNKKWAGTDSDVFIQLFGENGRSDEINLDNKWRNDFEKGRIDKFSISINHDIGDVWMVHVWKVDRVLLKDDWHLHKIVVTRDTKNWTFIANSWVKTRRLTLRSTTTLRHQDHPQAVYEREVELESMRFYYQWDPYYRDLLPACSRAKYIELPHGDKWSSERLGDIKHSKLKIGADIGLEKIIKKNTPWKSFDEFKKVYRIIKGPPLADDWKSDLIFARERIQGVNPESIERVTELPEDFPFTDEHVGKLLRPGTTLKSEVAENRVYLIDYSFFAPFLTPEHELEGRYFAAPKALFYVNEQNTLIPLAIQLHTDPDIAKNPIFTPLCPAPDWLMAKMYFSAADFWHHQVGLHLGQIHLFTEPIILALHRQLPTCHPVNKLLLPHCKYQITINSRARELLIAPGGVVISLAPFKYDTTFEALRVYYKKWNYHDLAFPNILKQRNITDDPKDLPGYYFRDDGHALWKLIRQFVSDIIDLFYTSDEIVQQDEELKNWARDIVENGYRGEDKGFPRQITTKDELVELITIFIFTVSVNHSTVNYYQFQSFSFIPFTPASMCRKAPGLDGKPWEMGKLTMNELCSYLPPRERVANQVSILYLLSQYAADDTFLGEYPETLFHEPGFFNALDRYCAGLEELKGAINKRNDWNHMLPSKIMNSIAI